MLLSGESFTLFGQGRVSIMGGSSSAAQRNIVIVFGRDGEHQLVVDRQTIKAEPIDRRTSLAAPVASKIAAFESAGGVA